MRGARNRSAQSAVGVSAGSGSRATWIRGVEPAEAAGRSPSSGRGADSSARVFPPSNKIPTKSLHLCEVRSDPHDPSSS